MKMLKIKFIFKARAVLTLLFLLLLVYIVLGTFFINYFTARVLCLGIVSGYLLKYVLKYVKNPSVRKSSVNRHLIIIISGSLLIIYLLSSISFFIQKKYYFSSSFPGYTITVIPDNIKELQIFDIEEELEFFIRIQDSTSILNQKNNGCIALFEKSPNIISLAELLSGDIDYEYTSLECTNTKKIKQHINRGIKEGYFEENIKLTLIDKPTKKTQTLRLNRKVKSNNKGWGIKEVYILFFGLDSSFYEVNCIDICQSLIKLVDFPVGSFLEAKDSINIKYGEPYDNSQTITWFVPNLERGIRFSYISPPFHNFRRFFEPLLKLDSLPQPIVFTFGIIITWIFTARGKALIYIKSVASAESKSMSEANPSKKVEISGNNFGAVGSLTGDNSGTFTGNQNISQSQKKQNLAEAAAEIQQLLEQLSQAYPTTTPAEKLTVVMEAADHIENNPTLKSRVVGALKSGGTEAFKEAIDHPLVNILVATIEGWKDAD
ncbi:MAG: hypothetical protein F6K26_05425 [Moorea sp. SIO2I5]|nr:hypothetical protein [Moorena sp. SIO2I5]